MGKGITNASSEMVSEPKRRFWLADITIRLIKEKPLGAVGAIVTLLLFFTAIFTDLIAPYGMNETRVTDFLASPSAAHLLGGDQLGRDLFSRIVYGARTSVIVGLVATSLSVVISLTVGGLCGYLGGKFDLIVQRFVDAWMCFPSLVILILVMSLIGPGLWNVIIVLAFVFGVGGSRIIRGAVMSVRENVYVQAAVAIGSSTPRVFIRHIVPNVMAPTIVLFTTRVPAVILMEAAVSFLGFGIPPPVPSWGGMLSGEGSTYMFLSPGIAVWPGLALASVVFGVNMFGDALRDLLDPRLRGGVGRYGVKVKETTTKSKEN
ncbi:Glutathione transport system permease protein GsiD [subsurface metagenome]